MYANFDIKKEQELIILNYYIEKNLDNNVFSKSIREISNDLGINKNRVQKLMLQLQEKNIIEKINSSYKSKLIYLYKEKQSINAFLGTETGTDFGTEKTSEINGFSEKAGTDFGTVLGTDLSTQDKNEKYKEIIIEIFNNANKTQIDLIVNIQKLEMIELDLFRSILKESALKATKNPFSYAHKMLLNTINDNVTTLEERERVQKQRFSSSNRKEKFDYIDNSEGDDFELLAKRSRER